MSTEPYFMPMPAKDIDVVEPGRHARDGHVAFDLGSDVSFSTAALESFAFARWEAVTHDALVVAAAVEYADKIVKRPPHGWARRLTLHIPVHDPARWNAPDVAGALHDALGFLTGDIWAVSFVKRIQPEPALSLGMLPLPVPAQAILAFSDGMDSRAVAGLVGAKLGDKLVRVRVGTKTSDRPRVKGKPEPFAAVPYDVLSNMSNRETSARTRGFKFAIISGIAAYLTDATEIVIPESGQGAIGPALLTVGHAYPDFRNHPRFTQRMERFLKALLGKDVSYVFPRIWNTKGETLRDYVAIDSTDTWRNTKSCWRNNQWSSVNGKQRQCGICAACMLRRVSVHAAGLTESPDTYICTDMTAPTLEAAVEAGFTKTKGAFREYAVAGILHMDHLADMAAEGQNSQVKRHATSLGLALGLSPQEASDRLAALLNKHAEEWTNYMDSLGAHSFVKQWARTEQ
ncbi:7-cyano-7-deazaguanine synthase [Mesorhizobium sp. SB112]|uniref:7-cyano-7-deazaguanine synthase n=1 Tax=Mesorhizobium sp. SB112 TaxID=3151853 RepID=UPI003266D1F9